MAFHGLGRDASACWYDTGHKRARGYNRTEANLKDV
jgi:hypothetical protein